MFNIKHNLILMLIISFISFSLQANEIWLSDKSDEESREFILIENEQGHHLLTLYHQTKGEYQDIKLKKSFAPHENVNYFIKNNFTHFTAVEKLNFWPTDYELSNDVLTSASNDIWTATQSWSPQWEYEYAQWLHREVNFDFFVRYNIAVDCADATIGFRWIFARIYGLPAANTQAGGGNLFGHFSMKKQWANLPTSSQWYQDQKFLAALNYIMDSTSTRSILQNDGLPVAINELGLMAGTFIVSYINNTGHLRTITENHFNDREDLPVYTYSATSPREVRTLYREPFVDQAWPIKNGREIMAFRWPIRSNNRWILNAKTNDYRYSMEQFSSTLPPQYYSFIHYVLEKTNPHYEPRSLVTTGIQNVMSYVNLRIKIVIDGYNFCSRYSCPKNSRAYDDWSTPSRDHNMRTKFLDTENLLQTFDPLFPGLVAHWNDSLERQQVSIQGQDLSLARIRYLFINNLVSSDPNDSINKRWGF